MTGDRRPLATRDLAVSRRLAARLVAAGWSANGISIAGMGAGVVGGVLLACTASGVEPVRAGFILGAVCVQLRLLANMLDGMVALESGQASAVGELYNEVPDRVADAAILIGLGHAAGGHIALGYVAALLALFTAYVRAAVKVAGAPSDFCGPMAKPHRMFLVTVVALYCGLTPTGWWSVSDRLGVPAAGLIVIGVGSAWTAWRRLWRGARTLRRAT